MPPPHEIPSSRLLATTNRKPERNQLGLQDNFVHDGLDGVNVNQIQINKRKLSFAFPCDQQAPKFTEWMHFGD